MFLLSLFAFHCLWLLVPFLDVPLLDFVVCLVLSFIAVGFLHFLFVILAVAFCCSPLFWSRVYLQFFPLRCGTVLGGG